jgi:hypothetical protein
MFASILFMESYHERPPLGVILSSRPWNGRFTGWETTHPVTVSFLCLSASATTHFLVLVPGLPPLRDAPGPLGSPKTH